MSGELPVDADKAGRRPFVGVDCRTIKLGIENGTIPTVNRGPGRMIPCVPLLRDFGIDA